MSNVPSLNQVKQAVIEQPVNNPNQKSRTRRLVDLLSDVFIQLGQHIKYLSQEPVTRLEWAETLADYRIGSIDQLEQGLANVKQMAREAGGKIELDVHRFGRLCYLVPVEDMPSCEQAYAEAQQAAHDPVGFAARPRYIGQKCVGHGYTHWAVYIAGKDHWGQIRGDYGMHNDDHNQVKQEFIKRYERCQVEASRGADRWSEVPGVTNAPRIEHKPIEGDEKEAFLKMLRECRK